MTLFSYFVNLSEIIEATYCKVHNMAKIGGGQQYPAKCLSGWHNKLAENEM